MATQIRVLCLHFTEIVDREVGETMRSFGVKKVREMRFMAPFCASSVEGAKSLQEACHVTLCLPVKLRQNRFRFGGVIPEK